MWGRNFAKYCVGKTAVELVTQVPLAVGTSILGSLSHGPIAGKGGVTEEAALGLVPSGWHNSLL